MKGRDGQVRGAQLKVLSKAGKQTTVFCPLQKLIPFEIGENHSDDEDTVNEGQLIELPEEPEYDEESSSEKNITLGNQDSGRRNKRKAAIEGQNLHRLCEQLSLVFTCDVDISISVGMKAHACVNSFSTPFSRAIKLQK